MSDQNQRPRSSFVERFRADISERDREVTDWLNGAGGAIFLGVFAVGFVVFLVLNFVIG